MVCPGLRTVLSHKSTNNAPVRFIRSAYPWIPRFHWTFFRIDRDLDRVFLFSIAIMIANYFF